MTVNDQLPDPQSLGYEEARDELVRIVQSLEGGQAPLEATLTLWRHWRSAAHRSSMEHSLVSQGVPRRSHRTSARVMSVPLAWIGKE